MLAFFCSGSISFYWGESGVFSSLRILCVLLCLGCLAEISNCIKTHSRSIRLHTVWYVLRTDTVTRRALGKDCSSHGLHTLVADEVTGFGKRCLPRPRKLRLSSFSQTAFRALPSQSGAIFLQSAQSTSGSSPHSTDARPLDQSLT